MGNPVKIAAKKPATVSAKAAVAGKPAKEKKERKPRAARPAVEISLDDNNIPEFLDSNGALIIGISPKTFTEHLTEEQKKDKNIRHLAKGRALEYMAALYAYRAKEHNEKKNPKKKMLAQYAKLMEKMKAMQAELGEDVEAVEEVEA